tara:strand:+ start:3472 stop:4392 length:921 start_codon:yes stop_codon:yes gene_type:complete
MNLLPKNQTNLYGLEKYFLELKYLYTKEKLPNKILLTGQKGIGKSTLAYHFINFVLSKNEVSCYDTENLKINSDNKSYKLILNTTHTNFYLIDLGNEKKNIDISQIRELISYVNKSSFNQSPRFVLIDNIEFLNINSVNALLKVLEEPNTNIHFILINNNKKILDTLKSRCINFKIHLENDKSISIANKLLDNKLNKLVNDELLSYYTTPGNIYNLVKFSNENDLDLKDLPLKNFLTFLIENNYYKKDSPIRYMFYDFFELFLTKKIIKDNSKSFNSFLKKIDNVKKFNLDQESLFIEFQSKILNV